MNSGLCDVVMGIPIGMEEASTTQPYYRSSYAFVSRRDRNLRIRSFDDPQLRRLRIGVHIQVVATVSAQLSVPSQRAVSSKTSTLITSSAISRKTPRRACSRSCTQ
jgi:hypothetical protein